METLNQGMRKILGSATDERDRGEWGRWTVREEKEEAITHCDD